MRLTPSRSINIESVQSSASDDSPPLLSFISFLDDNFNEIPSTPGEHIAQFENDREVSFKYIYHAKENHNQFEKIEQRLSLQPGCRRFWRKFIQSNNVYILDKFFDSKDFKRVISEVDKASHLQGYQPMEIYIISDEIDSLRKININGLKATFYFAYANRLANLKYIHDRFVLLDDKIWHFGAKAGGMHKCFSAVTGGWPDKGQCFKEFCKNFFQ